MSTEILGQHMALNQLSRAITNQRLNHAYLFLGPEGVGKKLTALEIAKVLNCEQAQGIQACQICNSCNKNRSRNHPQVYLTEPDGNSIKIQQIRQVQEQLKYRAFDGVYQVVIIEGLESITTQAANSLLKTLEEPPEDTVFLLLAQDMGSILPTIISRCQLIKFNPLPVESIKEILLARDIGIEQATLASQLARGSAATAIELCQQDELENLRQIVIQMVALINAKDTLALLKLGEGLIQDKASIAKLLDLLIVWYRDLLVWKETGSSKLLVNSDRMEVLTDELSSIPMLVEKMEHLTRCRRQLNSHVNEVTAMESLLMQLSR